MQIIPGGEIPIDDIVGRDALVTSLIATLQNQSIRLVAERRVGKSTVLRSVQAKAPANWLVIRRDVAAVVSADEFVQNIILDLSPHLDAISKVIKFAANVAQSASGTKLGPVTLPNFAGKHWKLVLNELFIYLQAESQHQKIVFLWDELPWMLQKITRNNAKEAMDLLDLLRSLRQTHNKVRMVYTGSLGLHHVVRVLKEQGYNGAPTNDMQVIDVPALNPADAETLVKRLCEDNHIACQDKTIYELIAQAVDHVPFYIHLILSSVQKNQTQKPLTAHAMSAYISAGITSSEDPWELKHYLDRTNDYYKELRAPSLSLVDAVASHAQAIPIQTAINAAKASHPSIEHDTWIELMNLLVQDHYFNRNTSNHTLSFKFTVVKQWWVHYRALTLIQSSGRV